jgi:hypothetical protein
VSEPGIRKGTNLGPLDLESSQKGASSLSSLIMENGMVELYAHKMMVTTTERVIMWFNVVLQYGWQ